MPIFKPEPLERLARDIFEAITVSPTGAAWMATLLVRANLPCSQICGGIPRKENRRHRNQFGFHFS